MSREVRYGPRKLGDAEFARQEAELKYTTPKGVVYGPRKGNDPDAEATAAPAPPEVQESGETSEKPNPFQPEGDTDASLQTTVAELEALLAEDPELFDLAYEAEFKDGKPRKGAVRVLLAIEKAKPEPRPQVVKVLEGLL